MQKLKARFNAFFVHDAAGGIVLLAAALFALVLANSRLSPVYDAILETPVSLRIGAFGIDKPLLLWINDGLMAVFFFLVGLELKRELLVGELSSLKRAFLPFIAALGGMVVPALVYLAINSTNPVGLKGWAIPAATDIAFAIGVLALLGPRIPTALKVFLLALAIIDDLGAIIIIAVFYAHDLSTTALVLALMCITVLLALNQIGVRTFAPYVLVGIIMWACVLKSGVHATLAGVALAMAIPLRDGEDTSMAERAEHAVAPWVHFGVAPIFAFANAGVSLAGVTIATALAPIPLGIAAGLFVGKQIGIFGSTWLAVRSGLGELPNGANWRHIYGVAILGGIGFTMSLFIGTLAFPDPAYAAAIRIGVLGGSLVSATVGYFVLARVASGGGAAT